MLRLSFLILALLPACQQDQTVSGFAAPGQTWVLQELDGAPFAARATLVFPEAGKIAGQAPCNRYSGTQKAPYPWFETGPIVATEMACPDLDKEVRFFQALENMSLVEVSGNTLILSNDKGDQMVFAADPG